MTNKKNIKQKVKKHRKKIIVFGIAFATGAGLLIGIKNRDFLTNICRSNAFDHIGSDEVADSFKETAKVAENTLGEGITKRPFEVSRHIRNLSVGQHASQAKIDIAKEQGIVLLEGQTLVDTYTKGLCVA